MSRLLPTLVFSFCFFVNLLSQNSSLAQTGSEIDIKRQTIQNLATQGDVNNASYIRDIPIPKDAMVGNFNLYDDYYPADITFLEDNQLTSVSVKYDIFNNYLNFDRNGEIRTITGSIVKKFTLNGPNGEEVYLNAKNLKLPLKGFLMVVLKNETIELYRYKDAKVKDPTYHLAMDVGERAPQAVIKDVYFVKINAGFQEVKNLKKKGMAVFGQYAEDMRAYAKREKLKYENMEDMKKLVLYFTELSN
jgi:hypothetical protein